MARDHGPARRGACAGAPGGCAGSGSPCAREQVSTCDACAVWACRYWVLGGVRTSCPPQLPPPHNLSWAPVPFATDRPQAFPRSGACWCLHPQTTCLSPILPGLGYSLLPHSFSTGPALLGCPFRSTSPLGLGPRGALTLRASSFHLCRAGPPTTTQMPPGQLAGAGHRARVGAQLTSAG